MSKKIGVLIGSLRKDSYTRKVAEFCMSIAPADFEMVELSIGDLSFYNEELDEEGAPPEAWTKFRKEIQSLDGVLFFTPEYNRSIPGALKNALDVGSRPGGKSSWGGIPGGVVSTSPGSIGGFGANHHLRQVLTFLDIYTLQQPEMYVNGVHEMLGADGKVEDKRSKDFLKNFMSEFQDWVNKF